MSENEYASITWAINNIRYCWHKNDEAITSPMFCIDMPEETKWKLMLFPRGVTYNKRSAAFFLYRDKNCNGPENIKVEYSLDIFKPISNLWVNIPQTDEFQKDMRKGSENYANVLANETGNIQQDQLIIRCKMIQLDGKAIKMPQIFARTIIGVEKLFFKRPIENFSSMASGQSFVIKSESEKVIMQVKLALIHDNDKENICFGIYSFDKNMKYSSVKTFIIDSLGQAVDSGGFECWFNCEMFPLTLTKKNLMENKSMYLPNDVLTVSFQLTVSTGITFEGIEKLLSECSPNPLQNEMIENWRSCISHKKIDDCPCALITELTSLYKDQILCDMNLKTKSSNFPVHTSILGARSPVFRAMFSSDMKEKANGCVDVSDLEDETVRRLLLYLYSDQLEDLKWDDAWLLYKAADKYAVITLKDKCSTFLKTRLNVENACEALMLSDLHQDKNLKDLTLHFILKNGKVVFKSEEWRLLANANSKLAVETMLRNWNDE